LLAWYVTLCTQAVIALYLTTSLVVCDAETVLFLVSECDAGTRY